MDQQKSKNTTVFKNTRKRSSKLNLTGLGWGTKFMGTTTWKIIYKKKDKKTYLNF